MGAVFVLSDGDVIGGLSVTVSISSVTVSATSSVERSSSSSPVFFATRLGYTTFVVASTVDDKTPVGSLDTVVVVMVVAIVGTTVEAVIGAVVVVNFVTNVTGSTVVDSNLCVDSSSNGTKSWVVGAVVLVVSEFPVVASVLAVVGVMTSVITSVVVIMTVLTSVLAVVVVVIVVATVGDSDLPVLAELVVDSNSDSADSIVFGSAVNEVFLMVRLLLV